MKEENFLNHAFQLVKDYEVKARWLMNQGGFNFSDGHPATITQRACIAFAVAAHTKAIDPTYGPNESLIEEAWNAKTIGELKKIINEFSV